MPMPKDRTTQAPKTPLPHPAPDAPARPDKPWTEEEKTRGAAPGADAGAAAGEPEPKGRPHGEREASEGAAAAEIRGVPTPPRREGDPSPDRG
jgi:hypothetical protein